MWRSLQSWNLVGVALQVVSVPYIRYVGACQSHILQGVLHIQHSGQDNIRFVAVKNCLPLPGLCIRAAIADLTFKDAPEEEQLKALS